MVNPDDPHDRYVFDVSFLLSSYTCIYANGCPGIRGDSVIGCCELGAHYVDDDDRERIEAMVDVLGPEHMQFYGEAKRRGVTAQLPGGEARTRVVKGGCIFLNRGAWPAGPGCSLHQYAWSRGEHHMTYKPEVCWIVPLRREVEEGTADDGEPMWTTTITSYDRGAWGPGGAEFDWWCTHEPAAYVGTEPLYRSMEFELRNMTGEKVFDELAAYLDDRRTVARKPLPFPIFVKDSAP
jgi:hypothetical protein